jgi:hypothetical protein
MSNLSEVEIVREEIADLLARSSAFDGIELLTYTRGDLLGIVNQRIKELGLCVVVSILKATPDRNQAVATTWDIEIGVDCIEYILLARKANTPTAWLLATRAEAQLKMRKGNWGAIITNSPDGVQEVAVAREQPPGLLIVRATFNTKIASQPRATTD